MSNATCFTKHAPFEGPPLIQNGELKFQAHHVGWIIASAFTMVATIASIWLITKHLEWYTQKRQQRYIIRLLFMVPIYAIVSLASYIWWNYAIPITLARDSYEALVLYSFFYLLLQYLSPTTEGQKEVFRHVVLKKWVFPLGFVKYRPEDGLYFLQLMKWGVLQYCVIRPSTTLAAVILDTIGLYCEASWSPGWGHVYITILVSVSVSIAMYCLIQLYIPVSSQLAPHKPLLKLFSVKAVVFLTFWQATGLSVLSMFGVVKDTNYMTAEDINTGIGAILETFEMMCFAFLHIRAFSYRPYREGKRQSDRTPRLRSLMHALDYRDMWRELWNGSIYMGKTIRGQDPEDDIRKRIHFARVMGRERGLKEVMGPKHDWTPQDDWGEEGRLLDSYERRRQDDRRAMLLSDQGDRFGDAFEDEVERELQRRGLIEEYGHGIDWGLEDSQRGHKRGQTSWWRGVYDRVFQGGRSRASEDTFTPRAQRSPHLTRKHDRDGSQFISLDSPPPPASVTYEYASPRDGRSRVRLAHSPRPTRDRQATKRDVDFHLGHHYQHRHKTSATDVSHMNDLPTEPPGSITTPQPSSTIPINDSKLLVSSGEKPLPPISPSTLDHDENRLAPPEGILRSDSLLARVFPNSNTSTADGHASSEGRINAGSPQDTLSTGPMFPLAISAASIPSQSKHPEPLSNFVPPNSSGSRAHVPSSPLTSQPISRSQVTKSYPAHPLSHRARQPPNIILPSPLSPAFYPFESTRHGHSPPQDSRYPPREVSPTSLAQLSSPTRVDHHHVLSSPLHSDRRDRPRSAQIAQPLIRQQRAGKRKSVPTEDVDNPGDPLRFVRRAEDDVPESSWFGTQDPDNSMSPTRLITLESSSGLPDSPIGSGPASRHTALPGTSPPRMLRHTHGNISKANRPWS